MRAVVLSHRAIAHELGLLEPWLDAVTQGGIERQFREDGGPELDGDADLLVVLGSPGSAADGHCGPAAAEEITAVRDWVEAGRPYFGVCFGSQVLARALGGSVRRRETTYRAYDTLPLAEGAPAALAGPWVTWHEDAVMAPPGSDVLATLPHADLAFRAGRAWGIQSHIEVTGNSLDRLLTALGADPDDSGPIMAALRRAEESAEPPQTRVNALLEAFSADALG
jgi:GMP synthase-like glutamine amidotransferase